MKYARALIGMALAGSCLPIQRLPAQTSATTAFHLLFERGIGQRDTSALAAAVAPELVFHERQNTFKIARGDLLQMANEILRGFPDVKFTVPAVVASGDSAAARVEFTGTHTGTWEGLAATGRRVTVTEMFFCRLHAGKLSECWEDWDKWGLIQQLQGGEKAKSTSPPA